MKKIVCLIIIIFSLFLCFTKNNDSSNVETINVEKRTSEKKTISKKELKKSPKKILEENKNFTLEDFKKQHNDNFICAMDYYVELVNLINKKSCFPLSELKSDNKPLFIISLVFPEMMRYSQFKDKIETRVTSILYSCGSESLSCSIGYMQMKPYFASTVERLIAKKPELKKRYNMFVDEGKDQTYDQRHDRILRLTNPEYEIEYLCAFIDIAMEKYNLKDKDLKYQLKVLSTAYNSGLIYNIDDIEILSKQKAFPNGNKSAVSLWNYSDLVIQFYDYVTNGFCF